MLHSVTKYMKQLHKITKYTTFLILKLKLATLLTSNASRGFKQCFKVCEDCTKNSSTTCVLPKWLNRKPTLTTCFVYASLQLILVGALNVGAHDETVPVPQCVGNPHAPPGPVSSRRSTAPWLQVVLGSSTLFTDSDLLLSNSKLNKSFFESFCSFFQQVALQPCCGPCTKRPRF